MRVLPWLLLASSLSATECIPLEQAKEKVGAVSCIKAQVHSVSPGNGGAHFLNFCSGDGSCPFKVVVFARDLRQVGDVRQLEGKPVEVHGKIQLYEGVPEIILRDSRQLRGVSLPPVPKDYSVVGNSPTREEVRPSKVPGKYDVERKGKHSAGSFRSSKSKRSKHRPHPRRGADSLSEEE
jgi:DNA/RNA endonuclease YhcR with UshA esterase domain